MLLGHFSLFKIHTAR